MHVHRYELGEILNYVMLNDSQSMRRDLLIVKLEDWNWIQVHKKEGNRRKNASKVGDNK